MKCGNLEWCSAIYNVGYGTRTSRAFETWKKKALKLIPTSDLILELKKRGAY